MFFFRLPKQLIQGHQGQAILFKTDNGQLQFLRIQPHQNMQLQQSTASTGMPASTTVRLQTVPAVSTAHRQFAVATVAVPMAQATLANATISSTATSTTTRTQTIKQTPQTHNHIALGQVVQAQVIQSQLQSNKQKNVI